MDKPKLIILGAPNVGKSVLESVLKQTDKYDLIIAPSVIPKLPKEIIDLISEYKLIQQKISKLSRSKRDYVEYRIKKYLNNGTIMEHHLKL